MWPNSQFPVDLVMFTERILSGKLQFLYSACFRAYVRLGVFELSVPVDWCLFVKYIFTELIFGEMVIFSRRACAKGKIKLRNDDIINVVKT